MMISACNKEKEVVQNTEKEVYWTQEDIEIQNKIIAFQNKVKNNSFKDGEMISIEDALWNLEALINFNYSNPDSGFLNLIIDTTFEVSIQSNNGLIDFNDIVDISFAMEEHIVNFTNQIPSNTKFMIAADVTINENLFKDGSSVISVTAAFGSEKRPNTPCYSPFEDYDYWSWGRAWANDGGYCDGPYVGQELDSDAAEKIQYKINNPECLQQDIPGSYVAESVTIHVDAFEYPNDNQVDNNYDCLMFYQSTSIGPVDLCLSPEKMDFYVQGTAHVVQDKLQYIQSIYPGENWKFLSVDLIGDYFLFQGETDYFHSADILYGKIAIYIPPVE